MIDLTFMKNNIELINPNILNNPKKINEINYWCNVFNWPNGWHYLMDQIWILNHIESLKLPKNATIIDAGANQHWNREIPFWGSR